MHTSDIKVMKGHHRGRMIMTGDASGTWMLHMLVPPAAFDHAMEEAAVAAMQRGWVFFIRCVPFKIHVLTCELASIRRVIS